MAASIKVGAKLPVALQLPDGAPNKFVRAWTYSPSGGVLSGPVGLLHAGAGLYLTSDMTMPNQDFVAVQYRVYNDQGASQLSIEYGDALDVFVKSDAAQDVSTQITELKEELLLTLARKHNQVKVAVSALTPTDELEFQVWLNTDGSPVTSPQEASLAIMNSDGVILFSLGPVTNCTAQGVFKMLKSAASASVTSGRSYTAYATVKVNDVTYASITSIAVF